MAPPKRIADEPAFVLHRYDWSESSLILEVMTRHHGRQALVAKGAKKPTSNFRPVLLPLQPLRLGYSLNKKTELYAGVTNLFDKVVFVRGNEVLGAVKVDARGTVQ